MGLKVGLWVAVFTVEFPLGLGPAGVDKAKQTRKNNQGNRSRP